MTTWQTYLDENQDRFLAELTDFLTIPSISALPEHKEDVQKAAEWVADRLAAAGMKNVEILPTAGHPVVYGDWLYAEGKPTILIYGHFDVQPADPLALWDSPPFEPVIKDERIYARGASDDKGGMLIPILAIEALLRSEGTLPVNIKFFLEGQEEIGSPDIPEFLPVHRDRFACDLVVSADGMMWSETEANIVLGLKGMCSLQIDVIGAKSDVHSGLHGGVFQNPIHALTRIIDSMRDTDGLIMVDGFYDKVVPLSEEDRAQIAEVPYDEAVYKADLGVTELYGEPGYTSRERNWARPTLEVNGIWGGFQGEGTKTVIPSEAHAKITCRLVANQKPAEIVELIKAHVAKNTPTGVTVNIKPLSNGGDPYLIPTDHPGNAAARVVLEKLYGHPPYHIRIGGGIPVCPMFVQQLGAYTVNFAFGLGDENWHAPNEYFRLSSFRRAQTAYCMLLHQLAEDFV